MLFDRFSFREREGGLLAEEPVADLPTAGRSYSFTLDTRQLVLLIAGYCFLCVLGFALGVVVGRASGQPESAPEAAGSLASQPREKAAKGGRDSLTGNRIPLVPEVEPKNQSTPGPELALSSNLPETPAMSRGDSPSTMALRTKPSPAPEATRSSEPPVAVSKPEDKRETEPRRHDMTDVKPKESSPASRAASSQGGDYTIQVGSSRSWEQANDLKGRLSKKGYAAYVQSVDLNDKGTWHRVRVGNYREKDAAERVANDIRNRESLQAMVTRR
jgi:cell division septation protein DedD